MKLSREIVFNSACLLAAAAVSALAFLMGETPPLERGVLTPDLAGISLAIYAAGAVAWLLAFRPDKAGEIGGPDSSVPVSVSNRRFMIVALSLAGFSLRIANLNHYGFCNDEMLFVFAAAHANLADSLRDIFNHFHPPTNFLLIRALLSVSWNPVWVRLPSIIGGTLAIPAMYLFARSLFGWRAGLVSAFLVTFSPNLILLSQVCRNYAPALPSLLLSLYFLARLVQGRRFRDLYLFALFEFLSVIWHYGLLPAFLGANLVLFTYLFRSVTGARGLLKAVAAQTPVGIVYLLALLLQLPVTQRGEVENVLGYMTAEYFLRPLNPLGPVVALFRYLVNGSPDRISIILALIFFMAAAVGAVQHFRRGRRWEVGLCLSFLPFSYLLAFGVHLLPFGGTRHSFYAFPFLFALAGGMLGWRGNGGEAPATRVNDAKNNTNSASKAVPRRTSLHRMADALVLALCGLFLFNTLKLYANVTPYYLRQSPAYKEPYPYYKGDFYKVVELPTRMDDLAAVAETLLGDSEPGSVVITTFPSFMILKTYLLKTPEPVYFDLAKQVSFDWKDRHFVYFPSANFAFSARTLIETVNDAGRSFDLSDSDRVWIAQAGWEIWFPSLSGWIEKDYPGSIGAERAIRDSRDTCFFLRVGDARRILEREADPRPPTAGDATSGNLP